MSIKVGDKAPNFSLYNSDKQLVNLSDFRGKNVLLHFYPLAFTSVCTKQLCNARDNMEVYTKLNCTVFGISIDTPHALKVFKEQQGLTFDLLSDFNKETIRDYDMVHADFGLNMKGVSKRGAFVIDKEGIVRYAEVCKDLGDQPDYGKIKETLEKL
jgi:glutaredoxin-dependent peroxiredoxin